MIIFFEHIISSLQIKVITGVGNNTGNGGFGASTTSINTHTLTASCSTLYLFLKYAQSWDLEFKFLEVRHKYGDAFVFEKPLNFDDFIKFLFSNTLDKDAFHVYDFHNFLFKHTECPVKAYKSIKSVDLQYLVNFHPSQLHMSLPNLTLKTISAADLKIDTSSETTCNEPITCDKYDDTSNDYTTREKSLQEYPFEAWNTKLFDTYFRSENRETYNDLTLDAITKYRRCGKGSRYEFLCTFRYNGSKIKSTNHWLEYKDLIVNKQYASLLKDKYGWNISDYLKLHESDCDVEEEDSDFEYDDDINEHVREKHNEYTSKKQKIKKEKGIPTYSMINHLKHRK